jgi:hypothetical protein
MRLSFITLFVSCFSLSVSVATNPQFLSRHDRKHPHPPSIISSRQYNFPRSLLDLCINLDVNLLADVGPLLNLESNAGLLDLLSKVHLCLCLKVGYMRLFHFIHSSLDRILTSTSPPTARFNPSFISWGPLSLAAAYAPLYVRLCSLYRTSST